jgi:hypothetical protein
MLAVLLVLLLCPGYAIYFEPPRSVDGGLMPTDFLPFAPTTSGLHTATPDLAILGREFNLESLDAGATWENSSSGHFSSVIHYFPKQCTAQLCDNVTTIGGWNPTNESSAQEFTTRLSRRIYAQRLANGSIEAKCVHAAPKMTFTGLPKPTKCWPTVGCMRLGGTTSVTLGGNRGMLMTTIVQWGGQPSSTCNLSQPVFTCNQSSIVVFKSTDSVHWKFLSVLADAHDHPESLEGPNEHDMALLADGETLLAVVRFDGGDGGLKPPLQPAHYLNYHQTISTDFGQSWSKLIPIDAGTLHACAHTLIPHTYIHTRIHHTRIHHTLIQDVPAHDCCW